MTVKTQRQHSEASPLQDTCLLSQLHCPRAMPWAACNHVRALMTRFTGAHLRAFSCAVPPAKAPSCFVQLGISSVQTQLEPHVPSWWGKPPQHIAQFYQDTGEHQERIYWNDFSNKMSANPSSGGQSLYWVQESPCRTASPPAAET